MFRRSHHRALFAASTSHLNNSEDLLSILEGALPQSTPNSKTRNNNQKKNTQHSKIMFEKVNFKNTVASVESISKQFSLLHPSAQPISLPYLCPPKWISLVAETVASHFHFQLLAAEKAADSTGLKEEGSGSSEKNNNHILKKAPRPELFVQSFVHPSFLRDYERKKILQNNNMNDAQSSTVDEDEFMDTSMASLAEVGGAVLQYCVTIMAPLMPVPNSARKKIAASSHQSSNRHRSSSSSNSNEDNTESVAPDSANLAEYAVFPMEGEFLSSLLKTEASSSSSSGPNRSEKGGAPQDGMSIAEKLSIHHFSDFALKTFASPSQSIANQQTLMSAVSSDHNLSLVAFNVWQVSELVLTDAGIFGLRDAMRSSSKEKLKVPPLPMPAAAMNVKAVVGAVYLNFGLEEAVKFCHSHVIPHAVNMMPRE